MEPDNLELIHYIQRCEELRAENPCTRLPSVARAVRAHGGDALHDDMAVFAAIRQ